MLDGIGVVMVCSVADGMTPLLQMADGMANCGVFW